MNKNLLLGLMFFSFASCVFSQKETGEVKTQPNGVRVHNAPGNEAITPVVTQKVVRTVDDWNLSECIDALREIDEKIEIAETELERNNLLAYRSKVVSRKEKLISSSN